MTIQESATPSSAHREAHREAHFIRHGQTDWNINRRWQGTMDVPLNAEGLRQADLLAAYFAGAHPLNAIYSSDLQRAWHTAAAISRVTGVPVQPDPRLREINVGIFQGYSGDELAVLHPDELAQWRTGSPDYVIPGGESRRQVQERAHAAWLDIMANSTGNIALVTHGGWIWQLLEKLFPQDIAGVHIHNTSITTLVNRGHEWELHQLCVTPHL